MVNKNGTSYRWYVLILASLAGTLVMAMPQICMPVLFKEIAEDLGLSLVEIGIVWGITPLAGLLFVLIGGLLSDRYGAKRTVTAACLLAGLAGALRGVSWDFISLTATTFLFGIAIWILPASAIKAVAAWFPKRQLGLANSIIAAGMGIGFTVGALISATLLSPLLGGWRNVMFLYGALSIVIGLLWFFTVREVDRAETADSELRVPLRQALSKVLPVKSLWLLGLTLLGYLGCIQGMTGYLPLYLHESGWTAAGADGTLAAFNGFSTMGAIPIALLSDRLGLRKAVILPIILITTTGVALLAVFDNAIVWLLVIMVGVARDGCLALYMTMALETERIGVVYSGTALGLLQALARIGPIISPPLGNSLADNNPGLPFILWAAFGLVALLTLFFVKETGRGKSRKMPG